MLEKNKVRRDTAQIQVSFSKFEFVELRCALSFALLKQQMKIAKLQNSKKTIPENIKFLDLGSRACVFFYMHCADLQVFSFLTFFSRQIIVHKSSIQESESPNLAGGSPDFVILRFWGCCDWRRGWLAFQSQTIEKTASCSPCTQESGLPPPLRSPKIQAFFVFLWVLSWISGACEFWNLGFLRGDERRRSPLTGKPVCFQQGMHCTRSLPALQTWALLGCTAATCKGSIRKNTVQDQSNRIT